MQLVNISDEESYKYCYVLICILLSKYFPNKSLLKRGIGAVFTNSIEKSEGIYIDNFAGEIAAISLQKSNSTSESIGKSTVKDLVNRLAGKRIDNPSKVNVNNFYEAKLTSLCRLIGYESWKDFIKNDAIILETKKISISQTDRIKAIRNTKKIKILISIIADTNTGQKEFNQRIKDIFRFRLAEGRLKERIDLEFDENERKISNAQEARVVFENKSSDLIIWGYFRIKNNELYGDLGYLISRAHLNMRIGKNSHRYDTTSLELEDLRFGKVFQKIDHIVFLILGISALLEDDVESAKNFLYNIPTQDWCDETCFVLGNCHYLSGQFAKGLGLWQKAISKNSNHLRAKINVARHQLSVMLREGGSLNEEVAQHIKESLSHYDPKSISIDELALMGVLYADLGEKEMAIEAFKAALKAIKKPQGAFYYYMKLGLLKEGTSAAEEYVNAALAAEKPEFQELCIRLIVDCDFPNDEKRKNLAKIRENSRINGRMGKLNIESLLAKSKSKTSNFNDFLVFEISGRLRKNGYKHVLKNGEMLNYDDWVVAENNPVKAVLIKCNNEGMTSPVKRLFLNSNSVKKVEETLYEYADPIKSSGTDEEMLLLHMRKLEHFKISKQEKVRAVCKEIGLNLNLTFDEVGKLILDRRMFTPYSQQITGKFILLEIQKDFKSGVFETIRELKILIPDNHEVEKRIRAFSEFIDFSDNKYYLKLAGYLSDFYATADQTDIKLWSVSRYLKLME